MGSEWRKCILGDLVELKRGYDLPKKKRMHGVVPIISSSGVSDFHSEYKVKGPGVVTGRYGTIGEVFFSETNYWPLNTTLYVRNFKGNDPKFIYYFLQTIPYQQYCDKAAVPGVNRNHLHMATVKAPICKKEQQRIAQTLSSLDQKIELNRQMNQTLEAMAQAFFKSWFVDFDPVVDNALAAGNPIPKPLQARAKIRAQVAKSGQAKPLPDFIRKLFPSAFVHSDEMGWIPEGWKKHSLLDLFDMVGGGTPKTTIDKYWNGAIPWFSVVDAPNTSDVFVIDTEKHVTQLGVDKSSTKILRAGTTIVSARGTVGKCAMVAQPMAMNQSCYGIVGKDGISDEFIYYLIRYQVSDLQQRSHGSVFSTITRDTFKSMFIPFHSPSTTQLYSLLIKPVFDKILSNTTQLTSLAKLRDTLLPKLISGELRIPDAEKQIKEAMV